MRRATMLAAGISAEASRTIVGSVADTLVAAGNNQATALQSTSDINIFTTVAAGTGALLMANLGSGESQTFVNLGANALAVYPQPGGIINSLAANASFAVGAGKCATFVSRGNGNWFALLSA